ncbi:hypothetical protein LPB72_05985 [Hydrogenophaga crassostreae]|uniref:RiboL-PSP-HEPN domain-containing protein n=1 Tax=Hydrogenophaga crassostreae TaxID=1763535 RepID=A0A162Z1M2_9BURK|nr:HEPN-associated N-terminal domain-containing protein [Hydrogenophaga crassostreae]AOW14542.1 hypothetical protein LPB072_18565 [Hydrogenophaga crassostreae]OAD43048.1 hypothetical protein LPB72_05985 [Hydrogenophaga crassostreae]
MGHNDHMDDDEPELPPEAGDGVQPEPNDAWLQNAPPELQIETMRRWFHARYEDPANQTPYSSQEGGYMFIFGGPYDPSDVIQDRFYKVVPHEVMDTLIKDLWRDVGDEWAPIEHEDVDYDAELSFVVVHRNDPMRFLMSRLAQIDAVLALQTTIFEADLICQMMHSSLIAALEAYLGDMSTYWICHDQSALRRFVSRNKDFKARTLTLDTVFDRFDALESEVRQYLQDLIWHRLDKVKPIVQASLDIVVPDIGELMKEVVIRHDIVHRAGRTREGTLVTVLIDDVRRVRNTVEAFAKAIETELDRRFPLD